MTNTTIKFTENIPAFVGTDMEEYGPYQKDQQIIVPVKIANLLTKQNLAQTIPPLNNSVPSNNQPQEHSNVAPIFYTLYAGSKGDAWTPWLTKNEWFARKHEWPWYTYAEPNYRQRLPNEIILETDYPEKETNRETMNHAYAILEQKKYACELWDTGGKGYHLHAYFKKWLNKPMIRKWVNSIFPQALATAFDDANWNEKRLIGIENAPHRKTGKPKTFMKKTENHQYNEYPKELLAPLKTSFSDHANKILQESGVSCAVCETATKQAFPPGTGRNFHLLPNIVAAMPPEKWAQAARAQNKTMAEFENWAIKKPSFNCIQLQRYAKKIGIHELCKKCPINATTTNNGAAVLVKVEEKSVVPKEKTTKAALCAAM